MKNAEINRLFSEKVADYIGKGYVINSDSMHSLEWDSDDISSWSFKANVDLYNGVDLLRIAIVDRRVYGDYATKRPSERTRNVEVLKAPSGYKRRDSFPTSKSEIVWQYKFYEVGYEFYGTCDEAKKAAEIRRERRELRNAMERDDDPLCGHISLETPLAKALVLPFVQRQKGFKRATMKDIDRIVRDIQTDGYGNITGIFFNILCKDKWIRLHSSHKLRANWWI